MAIVHDEGFVNLRKGLRVAIVLPPLYAAVGAALGDTASLLAAFACFASLVFADFHGPVRRQLAGYASLTGIGAVLVLVGSLLSPSVPAAALSLFVVVFAIRYVGSFGGYSIAAATPLMLSFVLAVMTTPDGQTAQRLVGWVLGGAVATATSFVARAPSGPTVRHRLAEQARLLAEALRTAAAGRPGPATDVSIIRQAREQLAQSSSRPLGPSLAQAALVSLLDALGRATILTTELAPIGQGRADEAARDLALAGAAAYEAAAAMLDGGPRADVPSVHELLTRHRDHVLVALTDASPETMRRAQDAAERGAVVRVVAALSAMAYADAAIASGHEVPEDLRLDLDVGIPQPGTRAFLHRARRTLAYHWRWRSTRMQNSLRAGLALAASLVVARVLDVDHGFWVVLGTLSVLRSGANDTSTTALQALRGTVVGFAIAVPLAWATDGSDLALWILLPLVAFLAGWAPGAIGLGSGQAAFTLFVVVLFNLVSRQGTLTAVVRAETVTTGIAVAVVSGFLFWPRGPEASYGPIAARLYRAARAMVGAVTAEVLDLPRSTAGLPSARRALIGVREQVDETLQDLNGHRHANVALADRVAVFTPPALVLVGDWTLRTLALDPGRPEGDSGDVDHVAAPVELEGRAFEVEARFDAVADALEDPDTTMVAVSPAPPVELPIEHVDARRLLAWIWLRSWLDALEGALEQTADATVSSARSLPRHWWR